MSCNSCVYVDSNPHNDSSPRPPSPSKMALLAKDINSFILIGLLVVAILGACNVASTRTVTYTFLGAGATVAGLNLLTGCKLGSPTVIYGIFVSILGMFGHSNVLSGKGISHWYLGYIAVGVLGTSCISASNAIAGRFKHHYNKNNFKANTV